MKRVEGSADGAKWVLFGTTDDSLEARRIASKCILYTKHSHVRIIEVKE